MNCWRMILSGWRFVKIVLPVMTIFVLGFLVATTHVSLRCLVLYVNNDTCQPFDKCQLRWLAVFFLSENVLYFFIKLCWSLSPPCYPSAITFNCLIFSKKMFLVIGAHSLILPVFHKCFMQIFRVLRQLPVFPIYHLHTVFSSHADDGWLGRQVLMRHLFVLLQCCL